MTMTNAIAASRSEPAVRQLDPPRQARQRAQQEHVVGAVGPAVRVEEWMTNQASAERDKRGL